MIEGEGRAVPVMHPFGAKNVCSMKSGESGNCGVVRTGAPTRLDSRKSCRILSTSIVHLLVSMRDDHRQSSAARRLETVERHLDRTRHAKLTPTAPLGLSQLSGSTDAASSKADDRAKWVQAGIEQLRALFPAEQLSLDLTTRNSHGSSWGSFIPPSPPSAVLHAHTTSDVVKAVKFAVENRWTVIPTGGRTALEGQFIPTCCNPPEADKWDPLRASRTATSGDDSQQREQLGASFRPTLHVSLSRMNKVVEVHEDDFQAIIEPGVGWVSLNKVRFITRRRPGFEECKLTRAALGCSTSPTAGSSCTFR